MDDTPLCEVEDSCAEAAAKIEAFCSKAPEFLAAMISATSLQANRRLSRQDREFSAAMSMISRVSAGSTPEWLFPLGIIGENEKDMLSVRALIETCVIAQNPEAFNSRDYRHPSLPRDIAIPTYGDLPALRESVISAEEFNRRVSGHQDWQRLNRAWASLEKLIDDCEVVAQRSCARGCGRWGAIKQCSICEKFYCSDSCMDAHTVIKQCKSSAQKAASGK